MARPARDVIADMIGNWIVQQGIGHYPDHASMLLGADAIIAELVANGIAITGFQPIVDPNEPPDIHNA